jgi:hypothetical protein
VGHDVVQLASDADALFPDLLAGEPMPLVMTSTFATVAAASTVTGQRRSSAIGLQATPTRRNCGPR